MSKGKITERQLHESVLKLIEDNSVKLVHKKSTTTITTSVDKVAINIPEYDKNTDILMVYENSTYIEEGDDYTISEDGQHILSTNGNWNTFEEKTTFNFVVIKSVPKVKSGDVISSVVNIQTGDWVYSEEEGLYYKDISHNLGTVHLFVSAMSTETRDSVEVMVRYTDENNITIYNEVETNIMVNLVSAETEHNLLINKIDDTGIYNYSVWSSNKVKNELTKVDSKLDEMIANGGISIDDTTVRKNTTWSSEKTEDFVLTNVGTLWEYVNGGTQQFIDNTMEGYLREIEIFGNTVQNPDDLSVKNLCVWNEEKQGYELKIKVSNSLSEDDLDYKEFKTSIILPCQLSGVNKSNPSGIIQDRLYWDSKKGKYMIEKCIQENSIISVNGKYKEFFNRFTIEKTINNTIIDGMLLYKNNCYIMEGFEKNGYHAHSKTPGRLAGSFYSDAGFRLYPYKNTDTGEIEDMSIEQANEIAKGKKFYVPYITPQIIETDIREEIKLPTFINSTYITIGHDNIQGIIKCKAPIDGGKIINTLTQENKELKSVNQEQDKLIDMSLLATDGMYMMMEPLFLNTITNDNTYYDNIFINMYTVMVQRELKNIEDVPLRYREQVEERLNKI